MFGFKRAYHNWLNGNLSLKPTINSGWSKGLLNKQLHSKNAVVFFDNKINSNNSRINGS
jgi:hypothetical protein